MSFWSDPVGSVSDTAAHAGDAFGGTVQHAGDAFGGTVQHAADAGGTGNTGGGWGFNDVGKNSMGSLGSGWSDLKGSLGMDHGLLPYTGDHGILPNTDWTAIGDKALGAIGDIFNPQAKTGAKTGAAGDVSGGAATGSKVNLPWPIIGVVVGAAIIIFIIVKKIKK
jgi:hypothetical protein